MARLGLILLVASLALPAPRHALAATSAQAREDYEQARRTYFALKRSTEKQRYRHHWLTSIAAFTRVASQHPRSSEAPRALYTAAELWRGLYVISRRADDLDQAQANYERVSREHSTSSLADDALVARAELLERRGLREQAAQAASTVVRVHARGDMVGRARQILARVGPPAAKPASPTATPREETNATLFGRREERGPQPVLSEIKRWSNGRYSRVVLYLTQAAQARSGPGQGGGTAGSVVVDLAGVAFAPAMRIEAASSEDMVSSIEPVTGSNGARLVLGLARPATHRVLVLENPYRVVIDLFAETATPDEVPVRRPKVVLDAGHGGKDVGAVGPTGTREKDVTLAIAKETARLLEARGVEVVLTRSDDHFVSLEERTAFANRQGADAFVSIHANAARQKSARGIETYYLDVTHDRYSLRLAAVENATNEDQVSDVQLVLADLAAKAATKESGRLARAVQRQMVGAARPLNPRLRDHGSKSSLFYVLLGARMPAILVETGFVSNPHEEKLLTTPRYQATLAAAIAAAVADQLGAQLVASRG